MPLSQFLLREVTTEHDLDTPEGRARAQFDAKPLLQAMTPTALRLQIVRGLASLTESTPAEIEALFELSKPVSVARKAPPRQGRPEPVGLELQIMRMLVAHPALALDLDEARAARLRPFRRRAGRAPAPAGRAWPRRWARTAVSPRCPSN